MTPALRKRHQRTWWFLGVALLMIWGISMATIQKNSAAKASIENHSTQKVIDKITVNYNAGQKVIQLTLNESISSPQTLVYLASGKNTLTLDSLFLGRIDGKGSYSFPLDAEKHFLEDKVIKGYDAIHQKELFATTITTN